MMMETFAGLELTHTVDKNKHVFMVSKPTKDPRWPTFASEMDMTLGQNGALKANRDGTLWTCEFKHEDQPSNACDDVRELAKKYGMEFASSVYKKKPVHTPKQVHVESHPERFPAKSESPPQDPAAAEHVILAMQRAFNDAVKELKEVCANVDLKEAELENAKAHMVGAEGRLKDIISYLEKYSGDTDWRAEAKVFLAKEDES